MASPLDVRAALTRLHALSPAGAIHEALEREQSRISRLAFEAILMGDASGFHDEEARLEDLARLRSTLAQLGTGEAA